MPFLNGINWAVLMFHKGTNCFSYLNVWLLAPGWDLSRSTMTDKINSTSLEQEGPAQRAQHSSPGQLNHVCRDKSLHSTHAVLCHLWPNDLSLQKLRFDTTKPEGPLASSVILLETLEFGEATLCLLMKANGQPRIPAHSRSPKPCWGVQAASHRWHRGHLSALLLLTTTPNPSQGWQCYKDQVRLCPAPFPALGSTSDVQHMPEDSLFSSGTQWGLLRSKMNSPRSCLWSLH